MLKKARFHFLTFYTKTHQHPVVKQTLSAEGYKLRQSLIFRLRLKRFVKVWGIRDFNYKHEVLDEIYELLDSI